MARVPLQPTSRGKVDVTRRKFEAGPLAADAARDLNSTLEALRTALNGRVSLGDGLDAARAGNLDAQVRTVTTPATPGDSFPVPHGLDRQVVGYLVIRKNAACDVYDAADHGWTDDVIWLRASAASADLTLLVF